MYAVLGMTDTPIENNNGELEGLTESDKLAMRVDYAASVSEVYQYVAKYIINRDNNLDVLCILSTHRDQNSTDLPTWVPDWRVPTSTISIRENWEYYAHKMGAAGFTTTLPQDQSRLSILSVKGYKLCNIEELLPFGVVSSPHLPEKPVGVTEGFDPTRHLRRMVITEREPATVPSSAAVGDQIWILLLWT